MAVLIAAGLWVGVVALPAAAQGTNTVRGTSGPDHLRGTDRADVILALGGDDRIRPRGGRDIVRAGPGDDYVFLTNDHRIDRISCGRGFDVVAYAFAVDQRDVIGDGCEGRIA